jgi:hypothetical protein
MSRRDHNGPGLSPATVRIQVDAALLARLAARLTERDRWLLRLLHEHRVLTLPQLTQLAFPSPRAARHRLLMLYQHAVLDRFRPSRPIGSAPHHYLLGPAGAAVLSAEQGHDIGYRAEHVAALAHSAKLAHLVGANTVFTTLAAHARHTPGCELQRWWSEHRCRQSWHGAVRPDGYGRWRDGGRGIDFFLEYDTGTEPLSRVAAKLPSYQRLADITGITDTAVVFVLPTAARERNLHALLRPGSVVPVATALTAGNPAAEVWLPVGGTDRLPLAALLPSRTPESW